LQWCQVLVHWAGFGPREPPLDPVLDVLETIEGMPDPRDFDRAASVAGIDGDTGASRWIGSLWAWLYSWSGGSESSYNALARRDSHGSDNLGGVSF